MKIKYMQGDMFSHTFPQDQKWKIYAHGCNTKGVMGSGVALQVKRMFPFAYNAYMLQYNTDSLHLGRLVSGQEGDVIILNMITQATYGRDKSIVYVSYDAVEECVRHINIGCGKIKQRSVVEVVMPKVGAGLANGDWDIIEKIIEEGSTNFQPVVYTL